MHFDGENPYSQCGVAQIEFSHNWHNTSEK